MTQMPPATRGLRIGRLLGAQVIVQPSALLMVALLAYVFASSAGPVTRQTLVLGLVLALLLFASIFAHEISHAIAARAFRRDVREIVVTLWGGHTSFDAAEMKPLPHGVTAAAGPAMNLLIALAAHGLATWGVVSGMTGAVVAWLGWANVFLAVFNLLPGIPMDGGKVLEAIVWRFTGNRHRGTAVAAWGGRVVAIGVIVYAIAAPIARGQAIDVVSLVWAVLIASILWPAASAALKYSQISQRREGLTAASLMSPAVAVHYELSVKQALDAAQATASTHLVVLANDGSAAGRCDVSVAESVPEGVRAATSLDAVLTPHPRGASVQAALEGEDLVRALREWWGRTDAWVVYDGDTIVGVVTLQQVLDALS